MRNMTKRTAIVVGGGIGGLTTALCLLQRGWQVTVLEAADALEETGAGLQMSPNAMKVLDALGLGPAIGAVAFEPEALELRLGQSGRRIFSIPVADAAKKRWGAAYLHIHRADLLATLEAAVRAFDTATVRLSAAVESYKTNASGAAIALASGETLEADLVVGADGIRSGIRQQMLGDEAPRFTGNLAWRMVVPIDRLKTPPPPTACVWAGRNRHAVTYRLRNGTLANLVGIVERTDWQGESWTEQGSRNEALADFGGWVPEVTEIIERSEAHFRWALFDRAPLRQWIDGHVALLGDACHPMLPFMAQGAAMAIEDAWVLADELEKRDSVPKALIYYQSARHDRTSAMQAASRGNMKTFHHSHPLARIATYAPIWVAGIGLPSFVRSRQDWIYGYDVTSTDR